MQRKIFISLLQTVYLPRVFRPTLIDELHCVILWYLIQPRISRCYCSYLCCQRDMVVAVGAVKAECWSPRRYCLTCCFGLCCVCAQLPSPRQKRAWPRAGAHCGMETCWDVKQSKYSGLFFRLGSFLHREEGITSAQGRLPQGRPVLFCTVHPSKLPPPASSCLPMAA